MKTLLSRWVAAVLIAVAAVPAFIDAAHAAVDSIDGTVTLSPVRYRNSEGSNGIDVKLSYSEPILCGKPATFTVHASGGRGEFLFSIYALCEKDTYNQIQDFSFGGMQPSNEFKITFDYNCDVDLVIQVTEATKDGDHYQIGQYTRPVFTFSVADPNAMNQSEIERLAESKADEVYVECRAQGFSSQYDTALWLHNWVIDHCVYDTTYRHPEASDLFVFGTGTCEAYHAAYAALLRRAGIECGRVSDNGHVWTLAKLDGEWCHIDTTGDDTDGDKDDWYLGKAGRCRLFGLNDDIVTAYIKTQDPNKEIEVKDPAVAATSLKSNYLIRSGEIRRYSDAYRSGIQAAIDRGDESFTLPANNSAWPSSYKTLVNSLVTYQLSSEAWYRDGRTVPLEASYANDMLVFSTVDQSQPAPIETQAMYRLYNPNSGEHFYTASSFERNSLVSVGWRYEGVGWYAPVSGDDVHRLYNPNAGDHHYTTSVGERDSLVRAGWRYEGVGWKSGGSIPLYRQYNPNAATGAHNFTTSKTENDWLATMGWQREGIAWYGMG